MISKVLLLAGLVLLVARTSAQVAISADGHLPAAGAGLDIHFTDRGFLPPRLTIDQRNSIAAPAEGLIVYCTDCGPGGLGRLTFYSGGVWRTVTPCTAEAPSPGNPVIAAGQITWNWSGPAGSWYRWNTTDDFEGAQDMGTATSKTETGTQCGQTYTRYVWSCTGCGVSPPLSLSAQTPPACTAPAGGNHTATSQQITWVWDPVPMATGYKWNTTNNYGTATDMGASTTKTETGLAGGTLFTRYVWAYNACGWSGVTVLVKTTDPWVCAGNFTDSRDNQVYAMVLIGTQCWMAQNLNYGTRINSSQQQLNEGTVQKYCYSDNASNCTVYGGLYNWGELMNYTSSGNANPSGRQGICPSGWHVPSNAEWEQMVTQLGGADTAGGAMKETGTLHWTAPNTGATNTSGYTALPGGYYPASGGYANLGNAGRFWSSTESSTLNAWYRQVTYDTGSVASVADAKYYNHHSARCCKD